ncbi:unnamed protein product [Clonostachys rosea]|uniref:Nicotinamide-nucleotide adenylyltransferase n=1 Tax=Bionectria ochroleuca TaxID=29856 RepID=A0ABY6TTN3_BIOOC|nr:unnamed protein product [Clonostachys rosea]
MGSSASISPSPPAQSTSTRTSPLETVRDYAFPTQNLRRHLTYAKTPLVLVACGSFSPITTLHLQLFELSARYVESTDFEIVGKYISPCSDGYGKSSLVPAQHRINMCALAIEERQSDVMIDEWEALRTDDSGRPMYTPTADVLKRLDEQINDVIGGIRTPEGKIVRARVMLLMGADLALTMGNPKSWSSADLDVLLGFYGAFVVERPKQCDIKDALAPLEKYRHNVWVVPSFENDVSSTKVREQIQNGENAMDLPKSVFNYIKTQGLYQIIRPVEDVSGETDKQLANSSATPSR